MNRSVGLALSLMGFMGIVCLLVGARMDDRPEWSIQAEPDRIELGTVEPNSKHQVAFRVINQGKQPGRIVKIGSTCGCTAVESDGRELAEQGQTRIEIHVTAGPWSGDSVRYVSVEIEGVQSRHRRVIRYPIHMTVLRDALPEPPPQPKP